MDFAIRQC